jgi:hypothetical protein
MVTPAKQKESPALLAVGIVTLVLSLGFVSFFLLRPLLSTLLISVENFKIPKGFSSPFVGLENYIKAFGMPGFAAGLTSSVFHSFCTALILFLFSLATGYVLLVIGRIRWLRHALCTLLLIPLVIPAEIWFWWFVELKLYIGSADFTTALLLSAWCAIKYVGLPALLVTAVVSRGKRAWPVPLLAAGNVSLALFALLGRFDFGFMRQMPPTLYPLLGIDVLAYRVSIVNMQLGVGAAMSVTLQVLTGILLAAVAFPVAVMLKRLFPAGLAPDDAKIKDRLISLIAPVAAVLAGSAALLAAAASGGAGNLSALAAYPIYFAAAIFGAAANTALCFFLARPAATSGKAGTAVMTAVLIALTAAGASAISIGEYISVRGFGLMNTWFAVFLSGIGAVWGVWPLLIAAKGAGIETNADWYKRMWRPAIALFAVQLMFAINNTPPSLLYEANPANIHPLILGLRQLAEDRGAMYPVALVTMAVPVALLLAVRTALNEKDSLALFLPGK